MSSLTPLSSKISIGDAIRFAEKLPAIIEQIRPILTFLFGLFNKRQPPVVVPPATGPVDPGVPGGPTLPQVPIDTTPAKTIASVALRCTSVEKPERVGGGPGVNYDNHTAMINNGEAFNFDCVSFWNGQARDQKGDEFMGPDLIKADLEFRTEYRVYMDGRLVASMKGEGDDNPTGEGKPAPWHQSESEGVTFGVSRWLNSAGLDNRIRFGGEGDFELELVVAGVASNRVKFRVS